MLILKLLLSLLIPIAAGYSITAFLFRRNPLPILPTISLSYGIGLGVLAQVMLILGFLSVQFSLVSIGLPLIAISLLALISLSRARKFKKIDFQQLVNLFNQLPSPKFFYFLYIGILCSFLLYYITYVFWIATTIPVDFFDALSTIALKTKTFYYNRMINTNEIFPHAAYPLHVPFAQTWIVLVLGSWSDLYIKIIFPVYLISYLSFHYYFLTQWTNRIWALFGTALVVSANFFVLHAMIALRDFTMMYYNCITIMLLLLWNRQKRKELLILAGLFSGFTTFVKLEGTMYLVFHTVLLILMLFMSKHSNRNEKMINFFRFALPSFGICFLYHFYKTLFNMPSAERFEINFTWQNFERIPAILIVLIDKLFFAWDWNILWFLVVLSLIGSYKIKILKEVKYLCFFCGMFFLCYSLLSLTMDSPFISLAGRQSSDGLPRIILHIFPIAPILIVFLNYKNFSSS